MTNNNSEQAIKKDIKKVCFVMGVGDRYILMYHVAKEMIRKYSIDPRYMVFNDKMINYLEGKGVPKDKMIMLSDETSFGSWGSEPVDEKFLIEMETTYGIPNLYLYWEAIRGGHENYDHYSAMKTLETIFRVYLAFIDREKFNFALMDLFPASIPMMVMSSILEQKKTPLYFLIPSRIENMFLITKGITDKYFRIDAFFDALKERSLNEDEIKDAENFISKYYGEKRYFSTSEKAVYQRKDFDLSRIKRGLLALIESYRYGTHKKSHRNFSNWAPFQYSIQRIKTIVRKQYLKGNGLFQEPVEGEKYVLFLLQKQPEASTFVKSPFHMDQRYLLEVIAKSLPIGYSVYVKPHHNDFGSWPLSYYKEMVCRPNIRMLKTHLNSQTLVKKSAAVITTTGTVGWEGIILGKPVITFGRVFYNSFDQVMHVKDITELPNVLRKAIYDFKPDRDLMLKYVSAHIQGSHNGVPLSPVLTKEKSLQPENIRNIVDGISLELGLN
ncbi:hypothetical protein ACFL0H_00755 [Thermodesulfobacteriota bacterium]